MALERDGFLFDVELLEERLGATVPVPGSPSAFRERVVALGLAGLRELDQRVLRGERPRDACVDGREAVLLPPFDAETGAHLHLQAAPRPASVGLSRAVLGHAAFVGAAATRGVVRAGVGYVLGEDLHRATPKDVQGAVCGVTLTLHWADFAEHVVTQAGPVLVTTNELKLRDAALTLRAPSGSQRFDLSRGIVAGFDARLVELADQLELRGGDLVSFEVPLAVEVAVHEPVSLETATLELRGTAVPRRTRDADGA